MSEKSESPGDMSDPQAGDGQGGKEGQSRSHASGTLPFWKRRWFRTTVLCSGMLLIGAALGSFVTSGMMFRHVRHMLGDPEAAAEHHLSRMKSKLELSDQQVEQIKPAMVTFHRKLVETLHRQHDILTAEIEQYLTEKQIAERRRIVEERHRCLSPAGDGPGHH
jgi:hypothetical protein